MKTWHTKWLLREILCLMGRHDFQPYHAQPGDAGLVVKLRCPMCGQEREDTVPNPQYGVSEPEPGSDGRYASIGLWLAPGGKA